MKQPDRTKAPSFRPVDRVGLAEVQTHSLLGGIPLCTVSGGSEDVSRIELLFGKALSGRERNMGVFAACAMLKDGTASRGYAEIAEALDYYGADVKSSFGRDFAAVSAYVLNKYLDEVLAIVADLLHNPSFPSAQLETYVRNGRQRLAVNEKKVSYLTRRAMYGELFGADHRYGFFAGADDFGALTPEKVHQAYRSFFSLPACRVIVAGRVGEELEEKLARHLFAAAPSSAGERTGAGEPSAFPATPGHRYIALEGTVQSSIHIGRRLFSKTHPDYLAMTVLNTVLGGYFGSRLMSNLREDKGYTYGVGSSLVSLKESGYLLVSAEVGTEVCDAAVKEIYREIGRLREEKVPAGELDLVRNYMLGSFLMSADGPFAQADLLKGVMLYGMDYSYYDRFIETVRTVSAGRLQELAQKYLQDDDLCRIVAGGRNG